MPTKFQLIQTALLVTVVAHDIKTRIEAKKAAQIFLNAYNAFEEIQAAHEAQVHYLCHLLIEHQVPVDEFDVIIALNYNM